MPGKFHGLGSLTVHSLSKSQTWLMNWVQTAHKNTISNKIISQLILLLSFHGAVKSQTWMSDSTTKTIFPYVQFSSVAQSCPTLCNPMNRSTPGLPVHHQLPEFTQTHLHWIGDAIQPSHPLSSPSPPAPNPSQHQGLFQWGNFSHEVTKVLEFQLQHQSFQLTPRTDLL